MQRRLSTILAADFVGYSRLMEADEEATVEKLSAHRETVDNLVKSHQALKYCLFPITVCKI